MRRIIVFIVLSLFTGLICITSCVHKPQLLPPNGNFPDSVANIFLTKCTNSGCHNQASYQNAAGLLLDTWEHLFQGGVSGAEVVAYSTAYSPLLYYCNAYDTSDYAATDIGHLTTPISLTEYKTLKNWIKAGAPDRYGNIPFAANPTTRQKIYLTIQACDLLAVIDAQSRVVMRYIPIGDANNKSPHDIEISADGKYGYIPFYNGNYVQKIDLVADTVMGVVDLSHAATPGTQGWSILILSPMDTAIMVSAWSAYGSVVAVNTAAMQIIQNLSLDAQTGGTSLLPYPHGLAANNTFDTFYTTLATSVFKYSFGTTGLYQKTIPASGQPHQIEMAPDGSKYFVTCPDPIAATNNFVRVYDTQTDTLIKAIPVGAIPQEMDISASKGYLFVSCMEDATNPLPGAHGSVYVIDYNTLDTIKVIYGDFYQPHDITVDEKDGLIFIPSRNANPNGSAPHHGTPCGGRPGWYTIYNLNTLTPADGKRYDVPTDAYAISTRFK